MRRIILMVLYNLPFVPYWWWQLAIFANATDDIPEPEKYALLKKIVLHANRGGRSKSTSMEENISPPGKALSFSPITRDSLTCWRLLKPAISPSQ